MRTILSICLSLFLIQAAFAQFIIDRASYTWSEIPKRTGLGKSDLTEYNSVILFKKIYYQYEYNSTTGYLEKYSVTHTCKLINDELALEANNKIYLAESNRQKLIDIKSRVITDGKVVSESGMSDLKTIEQDQRQYKLLAINGLVKNSMIETITKMQVYTGSYGLDYLSSAVPVKLLEYQIQCPENLRFTTKSYNGFTQLKDTLLDKTRYYFGSVTNGKVISDDEKYSFQDAHAQRIEYVIAKNTNNNSANMKYPEMGRQYFDNMYFAYDKSQKDVNKLLKKMNLDGLSESHKILAIENYLKSNIRIEEGLSEEFSVNKILKNKYTSEGYYIALFLYCFEAANINVDIVLTCDKTDKKFDPDFHSYSYLTDVMFYFPSTGKYMDPTAIELRYGKIKSSFLNQKVLQIKNTKLGEARAGITSIKTIPTNTLEECFDNFKAEVSFANDFSYCNIKINKEMMGYSEQGIREAYYIIDEEKKKEFLNAFIKIHKEDEVVNVSIKNVNVTNPDEYFKPMIITGEVKSKECIENAGDNILFNVGELIGPQEEMYHDKPRQNPIDLYFAHAYKRNITINIPDGYKLKGLEKLKINKVYKDAKGKVMFGFESSYQLNEKTLDIVCLEYYNDVEYGIEVFDQFKTVINAAADFNKISLLLTK